MPDRARSRSSLEETAEHAFYYCEQVPPFWDHVREWTARIEAKQLVLLDVGYLVDNVLRSAVSCLAGYWKFNTSLLLIGDFQDWLESLIKRALVGAVTGNRWRVSLKHMIRDFTTKYGQQLNLDRTMKVKSIEDLLSRACVRGWRDS